ncbi:MAG: signal peptidase I [Bacteroidales bacterium]|nr:signal peptidase I [Bacteroidales bacterium]MDY6002699.1 signal peptidase I [Candidatus Cryptobacteroides sp.]
MNQVRAINKFTSITTWVLSAIIVIFVLFAAWRIFIADRFIIPSDSMSPTLVAGDRVLVDKTIFGARIYKDYDFKEGMELKCWRTRGRRGIRRGDIIVFNFPKNGGRGISFKINYVFVKRCVGLPGDSVSVADGFWKNNNFSGVLGIAEQQERLASISEAQLPDEIWWTLQPCAPEQKWSIKNFGPLYVPRKGDIIHINDTTSALYGDILIYENCSSSSGTHRFKHDYFFMAGDNVLDSGDSRYWGFVPDDYIVGVVKAILFNRDPYTGKRSFGRFRTFDSMSGNH